MAEVMWVYKIQIKKNISPVDDSGWFTASAEVRDLARHELENSRAG